MRPRSGQTVPGPGLVGSADVRVAVLVSGTGSILDAFLDAELPVVVVMADRPCRALERAEAAGVPAELVLRDRYDAGFDREAYSAHLARRLVAHDVDLVAMAGFGTILGRAAHQVFGGRILNTHPALLPAFPGWHAVRDALVAGVETTGCTIHVAGLEVDTGPVLAQAEVPVVDGDDESSLHERIKAVERRLYPETIRAIVDRGAILPVGPSDGSVGVGSWDGAVPLGSSDGSGPVGSPDGSVGAGSSDDPVRSGPERAAAPGPVPPPRPRSGSSTDEPSRPTASDPRAQEA